MKKRSRFTGLIMLMMGLMLLFADLDKSLDGLFKTPFWGHPTRASLSRPVHPHRVAISNHRLVALANDTVTFRWRDSAHKNKKRLMTLSVNEFLRRFLLHVLPPGFVRIRYFGLMAHRRRGVSLQLCLKLLEDSGRIRSQVPPAGMADSPPQQLWRCPNCGGSMVLIERLTAILDSLPLSARSRRDAQMTRSFSSRNQPIPKGHRHACVQTGVSVARTRARVRPTPRSSMPRTSRHLYIRTLNLLREIQNP